MPPRTGDRGCLGREGGPHHQGDSARLLAVVVPGGVGFAFLCSYLVDAPIQRLFAPRQLAGDSKAQPVEAAILSITEITQRFSTHLIHLVSVFSTTVKDLLEHQSFSFAVLSLGEERLL